MSWKGVTKAISRLPHQMMARKADATVDEDFVRLEKRFNELVKEIDVLRQQSHAFRDAIAALLEHQMHCATTLEEIYAMVEDQPQETIQATQDYATAMTYCRDEILQQLDQLDSSVVQPAEHVHALTKAIQKTITKRQHKLIDYDRHRISLQKFKAIQDRSPSEDKQVFKLENQLATATQDYEYLNDMLKQDLVRFLRLAAEWITPIQTSFFHLQCSVIGGMYGRIYEVVQSTQHFPTVGQPMEQGYNWHINQRDVKHELESLEILQKGVGSMNSVLRPGQATLRERAAAAAAANEQHYDTEPSPPSWQSSQQQQQQPELVTTTTAAAPTHQTATFRRQPPPPPPPRNNTSIVIALYDLDAQQEGDLSIRKDDRIEVLERTQDTMDWWKGRIGDRVGMFPGNYVQEI
ncbi:BAR-domain-containing protein [Lichtheimia hyalospora FSU 10163]|nr:BAR-domain-containing protein [Lichtheimia hyalospora FSU 10163]